MEKITSMQAPRVNGKEITNEFEKYEDHMLTGKTIIRALKKKTMNESKTNCYLKNGNKNKNENGNGDENVIKKPEEVSTFFMPQEKDGLFWCFFVIKNGFSAYEYPGTTSFVNEKALKFKLIETMRENKHVLKTKKIKNIKEDVEDELANKSKIGMKTFIALCASENINVLFIHKKKCFELVSVEENPFHVIHQHDNPEKYCYEMNVTKEAVDKYRNTLFRWESVEKPLKAISAYKSDELFDMCKKLGLEEKIENLNKKTKKDLYELLIMNL